MTQLNRLCFDYDVCRVLRTTITNVQNAVSRLHPQRCHYRYTESGLSNVVLQNVEVAYCPKCGNTDVFIPRMARLQAAIFQAIVVSPVRLTGEQLRYARKHLDLSGEELSGYLHTDKTKISKWERGQDRIGPATDRLFRLLAAALDQELRPLALVIAQHLPQISDEPGENRELHVDVNTFRASFVHVKKAA